MTTPRSKVKVTEEQLTYKLRKGDIVQHSSGRDYLTICDWADVVGRHVESPDGQLAGRGPAEWHPPLANLTVIPYIRQDNNCVGWTPASSLKLVRRASALVQLELFEEKREAAKR
jgi:hypothetical protein